MRPWVESGCCGCEWGGLAAAEEKKKDEVTDGRDDTDSDGLSGGDGSALERGDEDWETLVTLLVIGITGSWTESWDSERIVAALALTDSIVVVVVVVVRELQTSPVWVNF